ncbi:hypothetical protein DRP04_07255 [Archaeoglobales archaeon]|nr:MAG: hypothetical protein DRP04_07255 [Archaeoglobales archaeon]
MRVDFRRLNFGKFVAVDITFYHERPSKTHSKILEILNDNEPLWISATQETRSYIITRDMLELIKKIADNSIRIDVQSLQELKEEFENDSWVVEDDYYVTMLKQDVYKF